MKLGRSCTPDGEGQGVCGGRVGVHGRRRDLEGRMGKPADGDLTRAQPTVVSGQCLCGAVGVEIGVPARWAWHDHTAATRKAQGAAYATYVGSWRSRFRFTRGEALVTRFKDEATGS